MDIDTTGASPVSDQGSSAGVVSTQDTTSARSTTDANPGATESTSLPATDAKAQPTTPKTATSIVEDVLKAKEDSSSSPRSEGQKPDAAQAGAGANPGKPGAESGEDDKDIPQEFHKHPRWIKMKTERDTLRRERDEAKTQVTQYKQDAEDFGALTGYMDKHDISSQEVAETLQWLALRNSNPVAFYEKFSAMKADMDVKFGSVLPPELQARVDSGELQEVDAKRIAQAEAKANMSRELSTRTVERTQEQQRQDQLKATKSAVTNSLNAWEQQQGTKDPDYARIRPRVLSELRALMSQYGAPRSPEEARQYADKAYNDVKTWAKTLLPDKQPVNPINPTSRPAINQPVASNPRDIVANALNVRL